MRVTFQLAKAPLLLLLLLISVLDVSGRGSLDGKGKVYVFSYSIPECIYIPLAFILLLLLLPGWKC